MTNAIETHELPSSAPGSCKERNYGIDLLRIVAMWFVPILHILGRGGILSGAQTFSASYESAYFLEAAAFCATNCYALISGFVGYGAKHRYANLITLCFQAAFYTVLTTVVLFLYDPASVGIKDFITALFPFALNTYWYLTAYFCMFFFIPFLNFFMDKAPRELARKLIVAIVIVGSVLPMIFRRDISMTNAGYSMLWLSMLYLIGAYIQKYQIYRQIGKGKSLLGYIACVVVTWGGTLLIELLTARLLGEVKGSAILLSYTSPTMLGAAVMLLFFFSQLRLREKSKKAVAFFAPVAFGVYLIHEAPALREYLMTGRFQSFLEFSPAAMILAVLGSALAIWLGCSLIDRVRLELFRLFRIPKLANYMESKLRKIKIKK